MASKPHSEFDVIREGILPPVREEQFVDSEMLAEPKRQALFALRRLEEQLEAQRRVVEQARVVRQLEETGTWPDFLPLANALDALDASNPAKERS